MRLFQQVDRDGNRCLTEAELKTALVNGDWSPFDPHTVRMMIRYVFPPPSPAPTDTANATQECSTPTAPAR